MKDTNYTAALTWFTNAGNVMDSIPVHSDDMMHDPSEHLLVAIITLGLPDEVIEFDNEDGNVRFRGTYEEWEAYSEEHNLPQYRDQSNQAA